MRRTVGALVLTISVLSVVAGPAAGSTAPIGAARSGAGVLGLTPVGSPGLSVAIDPGRSASREVVVSNRSASLRLTVHLDPSGAAASWMTLSDVVETLEPARERARVGGDPGPGQRGAGRARGSRRRERRADRARIRRIIRRAEVVAGFGPDLGQGQRRADRPGQRRRRACRRGAGPQVPGDPVPERRRDVDGDARSRSRAGRPPRGIRRARERRAAHDHDRTHPVVAAELGRGRYLGRRRRCTRRPGNVERLGCRGLRSDDGRDHAPDRRGADGGRPRATWASTVSRSCSS